MPEIRMRVGNEMEFSREADVSGLVGSVVPLKGPDDRELCRAPVLAAKVAADGSGIDLTLDVPQPVADLLGAPVGPIKGSTKLTPGSAGLARQRPWAVER